LDHYVLDALRVVRRLSLFLLLACCIFLILGRADDGVSPQLPTHK
jgi:hypothetical protein